MDEQNVAPENNPSNDQTPKTEVVVGDNKSAVAPTEQPISASEQPVNNNQAANQWSGPEFVEYEKNSVWYLILFISCALICAVVYLLIRDLITVIVIAVAFLFIGVYGARKPKNISYLIDDSGVQVGDKTYVYENFRNFTVVHEGQYSSIILYPLKRFAVSASVFFPQQNEKTIVDIVSQHLPFEQHNPDLVDRLMTRIKF